MLAEGSYTFLAWAPDGERFAATGPLQIGGATSQVALFAADGRTLARFPLAGGFLEAPRWSPDSRQLACRLLPVTSLTAPFPLLEAGTTLLIDERGVREVAAPTTLSPWGWTPAGRLALLGIGDRRTGQASAAAPRTVWTLNATGDDLRLEAEGAFYPFGWSPDGTSVYVAGDLRETGIATYTAPTGVFAIDTRTGARRTIVTADELAREVARGLPAPAGTNVFVGWAFDGREGTLALWLQTGTADGTPTAAASGQDVDLIMLDAFGSALARTRVPASRAVYGSSWSPAGTALGYLFTDSASGKTELHILPAGGGEIAAYTAAPVRIFGRDPFSWSPDGRWLAFTGQRGLEIAAAAAPARSFPLGGEAESPAWRPRSRP